MHGTGHFHSGMRMESFFFSYSGDGNRVMKVLFEGGEIKEDNFF